MSLTLEDLQRPLNLIYQAALEPVRWREALVETSKLVGAGTIHLRSWNAETGTDSFDVLTSLDWQPALDAYTSRFAADDPRVRMADALGGRRWMICTEHFDERYVGRSALWQEHLIPWGLRYCMAALLARSGPYAVVAGVMRDKRPFDSTEVAAASLLLPHLQRASALMLRTWDDVDRQHLGATALELSHLALLALTAGGRLVHANRRAESLLRGQALLTLRNGRLRAHDPQADVRLQAAVKAVVAGTAPCHLGLRAADGEPAWITVMRPSPAQAAMLPSPRASVLCVVAQGGQRLPPVRQLVQGFGLSPAEARVARALAQGGTLDGCARANGVSRNTVKTQLAHALEKMGLSDQRELIRLLTRLPAVRD